MGVIILVVAVFAIGRYILRPKKVVVKNQEYISGSSADGWTRRDLEAGPVDISPLLGGQCSRGSSRPHEHTAVELHGTTSMKKRLGKMFSRMNSFQKSLFGMRLSQFCSLVRSTDNPDLVWTGEVGAGSYGRVSLVLHDLGVFAIKELAEVKSLSPRSFVSPTFHSIFFQQTFSKAEVTPRSETRAPFAHFEMNVLSPKGLCFFES